MSRNELVAKAAFDRDQALEAVESATDPDWRKKALFAIRRTAERRLEFISDDVWADSKLEGTREDRALGPIFRAAAKEGWIEKTDRVRPSVRSHLSGKPVWRSLVYRKR